MKRLLASITSVLCLALLSVPALAHTLSWEIATPECDSQSIKLTFAATQMEPLPYYVEYTVTLTVAGTSTVIVPPGTRIEGSIASTNPNYPNSAIYRFDRMETVNIPKLAGSVTVSASATLYQQNPNNEDEFWQYNTVELTSFSNEDGSATFEINCEPVLGSLGDYVWVDTNGNGLQDETGTGKPLVDVYLGTPDANAPGGCAYDSSSPMDTTDSTGFYLFENLAAGDYCVVFEKPDGFTCTQQDAVDPNTNINDDAIDSDGRSEGDFCVTNTVYLGPGETDLKVDLGLVQTASLGNFVWEDLNGNGIQDNGEPGVNGVTVELYMGVDGNCASPMSVDPAATATVNDVNGIYGFDGLEPGDYCVRFDLSTLTDYCGLGAPSFTNYTLGNGNNDSDANPNDDGKSDVVKLDAGEEDLTLDAGIVCPAKIGDYVWLDADNLGDQNEDDPVSGVTVELYSCGPDGIPGNDDDGTALQERVTDNSGMYMFGGLTDNYVLLPGCYYVKFIDDPNFPDRVFTVTTGGSDAKDDSDCGPDGSTGAISVTSNTTDLTWDCGLYVPPPPCNLDLTKTCLVVPPPSQDFDKCDGRLQQFTLLWNGGGDIPSVSLVDNNNGAASVSVDGNELTVSGEFSDNDVEIAFDGRLSVFHTSCSDDDFNDPLDCGVASGDGKNNDPAYENVWLLEGFVDKEGRVLDCTPMSELDYAESCSAPQPAMPSCETTGDPDFLTWRYEGGTCGASSFGDLQKDFDCVADANFDAKNFPVTVVDDKGQSYTVNALGHELTMQRDGAKEMTITDASGLMQTIILHTSCSQPIVVGETAGALKLVALDGQYGGVEVSYKYEVTNFGNDLTGITIDDDQFDELIRPMPPMPQDLANGQSTEAFSMARVSTTTTNIATATGMLSSGASCTSPMAHVTVDIYEPPCDIGIFVDDISDDALKLKLTNNSPSNRIATLEEVVITYPAGRGELKEVKLDGDIYKRDDVDDGNYPTSITENQMTTVTVAEGNWTKEDVSKRQLDPGEERTLEIKTFEKTDKEGASFTVTLKFGDDCVYEFDVEYGDKKTMVQFP